MVFKGNGAIFSPRKNAIVAHVDSRGYYETKDPEIIAFAKLAGWEVIGGADEVAPIAVEVDEPKPSPKRRRG